MCFSIVCCNRRFIRWTSADYSSEITRSTLGFVALDGSCYPEKDASSKGAQEDMEVVHTTGNEAGKCSKNYE